MVFVLLYLVQNAKTWLTASSNSVSDVFANWHEL